MARSRGGVNIESGQHKTFRVLIAGGGVAGLEAALALADLAGELVETTVIAPAEEFVYRPLAVREPFSYGPASRYPLAEILRDTGAEVRSDELAFVDPIAQTLDTAGGETIAYDALLLALGARASARYTHALTIDDRCLQETMRGLVQDIEAGYVHSIALVSPGRMAWPLPMYELALMSADRAFDSGVELAVTIVTPEEEPLAIFGGAASDAVRALLGRAGVEFVGSAYAEIPAAGELVIHPGQRRLKVERAIALPELYGPSVRGVPLGEHGFVRIDPYCQVPDAGPVFAAGDATEFPIKHGGIATQQADVAAEKIAALAGADVTPARFRPHIEGTLLTGRKPLRIASRLSGGHGYASEVSEVSDPSAAPKITARYLAAALEAYDAGVIGAR